MNVVVLRTLSAKYSVWGSGFCWARFGHTHGPARTRAYRREQLSGNNSDTQACVRTIQAPAQLDMNSRGDFCDCAVRLLEEMSPGEGCLIIDLATTHYVDTSAVGTLAQLQGKAAERRNVIRLLNANDEIKFALLLARMDELFEMEAPEGE